MKVYLAGTITGDKATHEWRHNVGMRLLQAGIASLSPLRHMDVRDISGDGLRQEMSASLFVQRDEMDIKSCDVVLLNTLGVERLKRQSIGTWAEMALAHVYGKALIIVADQVSVIEHPFPVVWATLVVATLREAVEAIKFLRP